MSDVKLPVLRFTQGDMGWWYAHLSGPDTDSNGIGKTPDEALFNAAAHWMRTEEKKRKNKISTDSKELLEILAEEGPPKK